MGGIDTEYGMEYQKMVLLYFSCCLNTSFDAFQFDGDDKDDVTCLNYEFQSKKYIQAKTGTLKKEEKINVLLNWIKVCPSCDSTFELFSEKNMRFDIKQLAGETKKYILKKGALADPKTNLRQAFNACLDSNGEFSNDLLEGYVSTIITGYVPHINTSYKMLFESMASIYQSSKLTSLYTLKQVESHIYYLRDKLHSYIADNIEAAKKESKPLVLIRNTINQWLIDVKNEYGLDSYNFHYSEFKKRHHNVALSDEDREIRQLRLLGLDETIILEYSIQKIFYEDFKDYYLNICFDDSIEDIELAAYSNYQLKKLGQNLHDKKDCVAVFKDTMASIISSRLLDDLDAPVFCSNGCYIHLTRNDIDKRKQITWVLNDE